MAVCNAGTCTVASATDGTSCSDGNPCNGIEVCVSGACAMGTPLDCDDGNPCTIDGCGASGCAHVDAADGTPPGGPLSCATGLLGACSAGTRQCVSGAATCVPVQAPAPDDDCDGVDDDCDGEIDQGYVPDTSCFKPGACAAGNAASSCHSGIVTPCTAGAPTGVAESICNGIDDDCNGQIDEGAAVTACLKTVNLIVVYDAAFEVQSKKPTKDIAEAFGVAKMGFEQAALVPAVTLHLGAQVAWVDVVPSGMTYPPTSDPLDGQALLAAFTLWVGQHRDGLGGLAGSPADHVLLVTGHTLNAAPPAALGGMCGPGSTSVINVDSQASAAELGAAIAGAVGRSLGMPNADGFTAANASAVTSWFNTTYATGGVPRCLDDRPTDDWKTPRCGDGRIEGPEDCDPGLGVADACCTACRLAPGCACADTQPCCANGAIKPSGGVCRPAVDLTCDVADLCDGVHARCGVDMYAATGTACTDGGVPGIGAPPLASYCHAGHCVQSRVNQCRGMNGGQFPASLGCVISTSCTTLQCGMSSECQFSWNVAPDDGTPCGGTAPYTQRICVSGVCTTTSSIPVPGPTWETGPWSACASGMQTRTVGCAISGIPLSASSCEQPAPWASRPCP
ncbi:Tryptophan synthase alpha chain [Minicystis rosea]|nr:Tryptophan synthase alpha chain [Minicystis rosea]